MIMGNSNAGTAPTTELLNRKTPKYRSEAHIWVIWICCTGTKEINRSRQAQAEWLLGAKKGKENSRNAYNNIDGEDVG